MIFIFFILLFLSFLPVSSFFTSFFFQPFPFILLAFEAFSNIISAFFTIFFFLFLLFFILPVFLSLLPAAVSSAFLTLLPVFAFPSTPSFFLFIVLILLWLFFSPLSFVLSFRLITTIFPSYLSPAIIPGVLPFLLPSRPSFQPSFVRFVLFSSVPFLPKAALFPALLVPSKLLILKLFVVRLLVIFPFFAFLFLLIFLFSSVRFILVWLGFLFHVLLSEALSQLFPLQPSSSLHLILLFPIFGLPLILFAVAAIIPLLPSFRSVLVLLLLPPLSSLALPVLFALPLISLFSILQVEPSEIISAPIVLALFPQFPALFILQLVL